MTGFIEDEFCILDSMKKHDFYGTITDRESKLQLLIKNTNEKQVENFKEGKKLKFLVILK